MNEPVISREAIAIDADAAAARFVEHRVPQPNPFDAHLEPQAHAIWKASFERYLLARSAGDDCEASA